MRARRFLVVLCRGIGGSVRAGFGLLGLALFVILLLAGWDHFMDVTDEMGMDPDRLRLYRAERATEQPVTPSAVPEDRVLTNTLGMRFVRIPSGEYVMGSRSDELGHRIDELPHRVWISRAFYLGMHEVTVSQFRRFVEQTGYRPYESECSGTNRSAEAYYLAPAPQGTHYSWRDAGFHQGDDHPVVNVSWLDAVEFCRWLSRTDGRPYRLPTEAEWEYACRAGSTQAYTLAAACAECPFPENLATSGRIKAVTIASWDDGFEYTAPVGSFPPNPWGLRDMHGNVAEYCLDWYGMDYYRQSPRKDPQGPASGDFRVLRGGSWCQTKACSRSGGRSMCRETIGVPFAGFRVAADDR